MMHRAFIHGPPLDKSLRSKTARISLDDTSRGWSKAERLESASVIRNAPGGEYISDLEVELCSRVSMLPLTYLAVKDALVQ